MTLQAAFAALGELVAIFMFICATIGGFTVLFLTAVAKRERRQHFRQKRS